MWRCLKEGVGSALGHVDLDCARRTNKPRRNGIAKEVNSVTTRGERKGELARDDARAAISGVA